MNSSQCTPPSLALGTHKWGVDPSELQKQEELMAAALKYGITALDTAPLYGSGASESAIGKLNAKDDLVIHTKSLFGKGQSGYQPLQENLEKSMDRLCLDKVAIFLLHAPDPDITFEDTMKAVRELYEAGKFDKFGISNFSPAEVQAIYNIAKGQQPHGTRGNILPTAYQASYSLAGRRCETELFPMLRELGMSIQAYSPIAGGFLAKTPAEIEAGAGRWGNPAEAPIYQVLYGDPQGKYKEFLRRFTELAIQAGETNVGLAYRWMMFHSHLDGSKGDVVILGTQNVKQLDEVMVELGKGPLKEELVKVIDELWEFVRDVALLDNLQAFRELGW